MLPGRYDNDIIISVGSPLDLPPGLQHRPPEHHFPIPGRVVQKSHGRDVNLVHDVTKPPPSSPPGIGECGLGFVFGKLPAFALELFWVDVEGGGQPGTGGFREHARDIVKRGDPMPSEMAPPRKHGVIDHAFDFAFFQFMGDVGPVPTDLAPDQRIGMGAYGFTIGRHVKPWPVATHLMMVHVCLGRPLHVHDPGRVS